MELYTGYRYYDYDPGPNSDGLGEDRLALQRQIGWLHEILRTDTHVIVAHDLLALEADIANGVIEQGLYLGEQD